MFFSVIIPTYKISTAMLERAFQSVKNQKETDWEIIVVDDNSEGSFFKKSIKELAQKNNDPEINFIFHENNKGANAARNTGIKYAKGEVIAFLDSDDEWDSDYLNLVRSKYENTNCIMTAASVIRVYSNRKAISKVNHNDGYIYDDLLFRDIVGPTSAVTVRRKYLMLAGMFDEKLPARQDYDMWLRLSPLGNISYLRYPLIIIHCEEEHERISAGYEKHIKGTLMVLDKILNKNITEPQKNNIASTHLSYIALQYLKHKKIEESRIFYKRSMNYATKKENILGYIMTYVPFILFISIKFKRVNEQIQWERFSGDNFKSNQI